MRMRKKRHGDERLAALSALFVPYEGEESWDLPSLYEKDAPIRIEIGCGKGGFITGISRVEPDYNYLAVEKISDVMVCAAEKYAGERGLGKLGFHGGWQAPDGTVYHERWEIPMADRGNVRFAIGDAAEVLAHLPECSIDAIYANFSDPWPKKGYADRRLTSPGFLKEYLRVLKPGGAFRFKTDNEVLFDYSLETIEQSPLKMTFCTRDLHHSERAKSNIMTEYERNFSEKGVCIKALEAVREG